MNDNDNDQLQVKLNYQFLANAVTVQMQMSGHLEPNQSLTVEDIEIDPEAQLLFVDCTLNEEVMN